MNVKLDENLPAELLDDLRAAGHEADTVRDEALAGAPDTVVLDRVRHDRRVFFTLDKGIADVRAYPPEHHAGIVLFRPGSMGRGAGLRPSQPAGGPRSRSDGPPGRRYRSRSPCQVNTAPITITRNGKPIAMIVSTDEYEGWRETVQILRDRELLREIRDGIRQLARTKTRYTVEELFAD